MTSTIYQAPDAIVRDWHDGDTSHVDIDHGWGMYTLAYNPITGKPNMSCRILSFTGRGIDAPELRTGFGPAALDYANLICPPGTHVVARSHQWDAYNRRWDGSLTLPDGSDFADRMVAAGHAVYKTF